MSESIEFRAPQDSDRETLARWIESDTEHRDFYEPEFWMGAPSQGEMKFVAVDGEGRPVAFVKTELLVRLYVQFPPVEEMGKLSMAKAIRRGCEKMFEGFWGLGFKEVLFGTVPGSALQRFMRKAFGFSPAAEGTETRRLV